MRTLGVALAASLGVVSATVAAFARPPSELDPDAPSDALDAGADVPATPTMAEDAAPPPPLASAAPADAAAAPPRPGPLRPRPLLPRRMATFPTSRARLESTSASAADTASRSETRRR